MPQIQKAYFILREFSAVTNGPRSWLNDFSDDRETAARECWPMRLDELKKAIITPNSEHKFAEIDQCDIGDLTR